MAEEYDTKGLYRLATTVNSDVLPIIEQQRSIHKTATKINDLLLERQNIDEDVSLLLAGIKNSVVRTLKSTSDIFDAVPPLMQRNEVAEELTQEVFDVPELLEHIFGFLPTDTCLVAMQVCRQWFDSIQGSVKLQRKLGLLADPESRLHFPLKLTNILNEKNFSSIQVLKGEGRTGGAYITFTRAPQSHARRIGSRVCSMLICQPPITELWFDNRCECSLNAVDEYDTDPGAPTACDDGITIGHLLKIEADVFARHKLCPHAEVDDHGSDGFVRTSISFSGHVQIAEDDALQHDRSKIASQRHEMIWEYISAKKQAVANRTRVPFLEEHETRQAILVRLMDRARRPFEHIPSKQQL